MWKTDAFYIKLTNQDLPSLPEYLPLSFKFGYFIPSPESELTFLSFL